MGKFGEGTTRVFKIVKVTLFFDSALLENENLAALFNGTHSVRNDDSCSVLHRVLNSLLHFLLGILVESRSGFIQKKYFRVGNQSSSNGNSLLLTTRKFTTFKTALNIIAIYEIFIIEINTLILSLIDISTDGFESSLIFHLLLKFVHDFHLFIIPLLTLVFDQN